MTLLVSGLSAAVRRGRKQSRFLGLLYLKPHEADCTLPFQGLFPLWKVSERNLLEMSQPPNLIAAEVLSFQTHVGQGGESSAM